MPIRLLWEAFSHTAITVQKLSVHIHPLLSTHLYSRVNWSNVKYTKLAKLRNGSKRIRTRVLSTESNVLTTMSPCHTKPVAIVNLLGDVSSPIKVFIFHHCVFIIIINLYNNNKTSVEPKSSGTRAQRRNKSGSLSFM